MGPGRWVSYCSLGDHKNELWKKMQGGDGVAAFELGSYFFLCDVNEAYRCFRVGEGVGNADCILMLADMHRTGCACLYDRDIAISYYKRALEKGVKFDDKCADALAQLQKEFPEAEVEGK
jgi:TPR repeat protein